MRAATRPLRPMTPAQRAEINARLDALESEVRGLQVRVSRIEAHAAEVQAAQNMEVSR